MVDLIDQPCSIHGSHQVEDVQAECTGGALKPHSACAHCGFAWAYHCADSSGPWCPRTAGGMDWDKSDPSATQFWLAAYSQQRTPEMDRNARLRAAVVAARTLLSASSGNRKLTADYVWLSVRREHLAHLHELLERCEL